MLTIATWDYRPGAWSLSEVTGLILKDRALEDKIYDHQMSCSDLT